jgi:hypothetical protein
MTRDPLQYMVVIQPHGRHFRRTAAGLGEVPETSLCIYMRRKNDAVRLARLAWEAPRVLAVGVLKGDGQPPIFTLGPFNEEAL